MGILEIFVWVVEDLTEYCKNLQFIVQGEGWFDECCSFTIAVKMFKAVKKRRCDERRLFN